MVEEPEPPVAGAAEPRAAFATTVFLQFQRSLFRYLRGLLPRREDAEDVLQETYMRLAGAAQLEPSPIRIRAFMFKVATNLAYDRFRQRRVRGRQDETALAGLADEVPETERLVALEQAVGCVERTLLGLPPRCRQVFLLRVAHDWSYESIAEGLGVSKRTVEREMQAALDACQRALRGGELP
jgi:RNA polymerase sigma factor (sigma-70 family)